jgi:hypothetical protein
MSAAEPDCRTEVLPELETASETEPMFGVPMYRCSPPDPSLSRINVPGAADLQRSPSHG